MMNNLREIAYRVDPVLWVRETLDMTPTPWQETFLRSPQGASILALTLNAGVRLCRPLAIRTCVLVTQAAIGFCQRNVGNRAKSPSVEHNVSPCPNASAAKCASGPRCHAHRATQEVHSIDRHGAL